MPRAGPVVLVVDDDGGFRRSLSEYLSAQGFEVLEAGNGQDALATCAQRRVDLVLLDQHLPDGPGAALCSRLLETNDRLRIVFVTAYPQLESAVAAVRLGATDYLSKPIDLDELRIVIDRTLGAAELARLRELAHLAAHTARQRTKLVGGDGGLRRVRELAERAAHRAAPVLITGETGTGKTVLARYIHYFGPKPEAPFVAVNAAAIPAELVASELFGHVKGAFTGADQARRGLFELAHGGTLFLDEIGSLDLSLQAKLLTVLEDGRVRPVGSEREREVQVRILCATNKDLEERVRAGAFREDLFFRLAVLRIDLPALRERLQDLPELCAHFLATLSPERPLRLEAGELDRLASYPWPGNLRELRSVLERCVTLEAGTTLQPSRYLTTRPSDAAPPEAEASRPLAASAPSPSPSLSPSPSPSPGAEPEPEPEPRLGALVSLEAIERVHLTAVLERCQGNRVKAAAVLGISESTLRRRLRGLRGAESESR